jgi:hypothetical protein
MPEAKRKKAVSDDLPEPVIDPRTGKPVNAHDPDKMKKVDEIAGGGSEEDMAAARAKAEADRLAKAKAEEIPPAPGQSKEARDKDQEYSDKMAETSEELSQARKKYGRGSPQEIAVLEKRKAISVEFGR